MINQILNDKIIALNSKNNQKQIQLKIAIRKYFYISASSKIFLLKTFKINILDIFAFFNRFSIWIIDKIHLIE